METASIWLAGGFLTAQADLHASFSSLGPTGGTLEQQRQFIAAQPSISVVVTARNYGAYLKECIGSIHEQSLPAAEIIYSDDGSEDESLDVVRQFPAVKLLSRRHEGIAASRNAAVAISRGDYLVHVDGDDVLTPDFLERHLRALQASPDAVFAYGPAEGFGIRECRWEAPPWNRAQLWGRNYVNTSAMYRRWAFDAAGGWRAGAGTCFDWDLALRASRFGPAVPSTAMLRYRQHPRSWSRSFWGGRPTPQEVTNVHGRVRQMAATTTIGCVYSGRLPELLPKWLTALAACIRSSSLPRPNLFFVDGSPDQSAGERLLNQASQYPEFRQIEYARVRSPLRPPFAREQRDERATFMASACNQLLDSTSTDVVWFVEDDVIVPEHAYVRLCSQLLQGPMPRPAVAGLYRNRHDPRAIVAHHWNGRVATLQQAPPRPLHVDMTGTGCLMILRPFARHRFASHAHGIPAHDWAWCLELKRHGARVLLDPEVACQHFVDADSAV